MACRCFGLLKSKRDSLVALDLIPLNMLSCLSWPPCSLMVSCIEAEIWGFGDFLPCLNRWFSPQTGVVGLWLVARNGMPNWQGRRSSSWWSGPMSFMMILWSWQMPYESPCRLGPICWEVGFGCRVVGRISLKLTERSKVSFCSANKQVFCWAAFLDISHNLHLYSRGYSRIILYVGLCRGWSKHNICNIQYVYIYIYIHIMCIYTHTYALFEFL